MKTKSIWPWMVGGLLAFLLILGLGSLVSAAPQYPAPGFSASPYPPPWDHGRPGITWCFVPGKGYAWFENSAIPPQAPPALPAPPACPNCPTCPGGQCPLPVRR